MGKAVSRMMIEPDATGMTMRARRRGFIGTVKTSLSPFEQDLYIFDDTSGVKSFCMNGVAALDKTPNKKKFPPNVYRVYNLNSLGFDGRDAISLFYNGKRQTLRFVGHIPKRYVIHDKFVFRVRYSAQTKCWQYLDPYTNTFRGLPFEPTQLSFCKEDFKNYRGDFPAKFATSGNNIDRIPAIPSQPVAGVQRGQIGRPAVGRPTAEAPRVVPVPQRTAAPVAPQTGTGLYVLKVRYIDLTNTAVGYGVVTPEGEQKKMSVKKLIGLARDGKVQGVKVVDRGNGEFLQGVGQSLELLPTRRVKQ
jgi:hypothetical protein